MTRWLPAQLSARLLLSSAVQLVLVGVALGLLGYATGRREGLQQLALERQRHQLTTLSEALSVRLRAPQLINRSNVLAIRQGVIQLDDFDRLGRRFWRQMQLYPVGYINWGSTTGSFVGVERLDSGRLVLNEDSERPLGRGRLGVYALGSRGERGALLEVVPGMDIFHKEAWYAETVRAGRAGWSSIYQWEDKPQVFSISYNEPVHNHRGTLLGVIGVDFVLSQLSTWLQQLWRSQQGLALIVEPSGHVVASSRPDLTLIRRGGTPLRARLDQLSEPLARRAASAFFIAQTDRSLRVHTAAISADRGQSQPSIQINGQTYSLRARPWGRAEGLNWLLITAINRDEGLLRSQQQSAAAVALGLLALGGAVLLNQRLLTWLLAPMQLLRQRAALACARPPTRFDPVLPDGAATELATMAGAFGELVRRLEQSQDALAAAAEREHLKDAQALQLLKLKLRSSLEASAIAHEIKLPLSQILLSSRMLLDAEPAVSGLNPATRAQLQQIANAADQVGATIEQMRTLLRNVQITQQTLNLAHVVRSALLYMKPALASARVQLDHEGLETPCSILGDSAQLQIAIVNVLRNSIEALQQRSGPRLIRVALQRQGGLAELRIDDNGPGLPADLQALEPLESGRPQGTGLGLFMVQTTVSNHRGSIALGRSQALGGASVLMLLPLADQPPADLPTSG
ncbi:MAG: sensor histidine kinase [Cyanobacteriota bacterium]|nr:sensor histidine kinase [Cyanobacteriota bacterium]